MHWITARIKIIFHLVLVVYRNTFKCSQLRPISKRFCDVTFTVKNFCACDVAKSLRNGPLILHQSFYLHAEKKAERRKEGRAKIEEL